MTEWKCEIKKLARDFYIPQAKVNEVLDNVESTYGQGKGKSKMPNFYNGNQDEFLYDKAQREIMNLVFA